MSEATLSRNVAARLRQAARSYGENEEQLVAEVSKGRTPAARVIHKLVQAELVKSRRGRKIDHKRTSAIVSTVLDLRNCGHSESEAFKLAPAILSKKGIYGPRQQTITLDSVRRACRDRAQHHWFQPEDQ